ncbi:hypothetical protein M413DRAFT_440243 [Hebeloma cylindrosporum]|uniref:Yippee domain-containing protein n=1 Tax=Hebeloma cylindrosporum TaxID=76867 RepID=A0A0C2Z0E6_HEBCY|nr:hypothetical protein M413DRAFT_440243 [Hebeloma cylindrosporum h7]
MLLSPTSDTRKLLIQAYEGHANFSCSKCLAVIALQDELISKSFSGRDVFCLMQSAMNIKLGRREDRSLLIGVHSVADVYLSRMQKRKYLLEREKLVKENAWKLDS